MSGRLTLNAGLRYDRHRTFGGNTSSGASFTLSTVTATVAVSVPPLPSETS